MRPEKRPRGHAAEVRDAVELEDRGRLQDLAYKEGGFCGAEVRRSAWLMFLGLEVRDCPGRQAWRRHLDGLQEDTKDARVMQADVQRSVYSWDVHTGLREATRDQKRLQLSEVMHAILRKHCGRLGYFQGFHDIVLVFLEVGSQSQAFHMVERLALFHLSDQLCCPFDRGLLPLLRVLYRLLYLLDRRLALALSDAGCAEMHFAVPWVLTWFAHSLSKLHQVMRLYDCLVCSHPAAVLYFIASLLMEHREALLQAPRDMPEMVTVIQSLPLDTVNVDEWAVRARMLMHRIPPERLISKLDVATRRAMPVTTPLVHFPHPWMIPETRCVDLREQDVTFLAPVYLPDGGASAWPPESFLSRASAALLPSSLGDAGYRLVAKILGIGVGGATVAAALGLLLQALGYGSPAESLNRIADKE